MIFTKLASQKILHGLQTRTTRLRKHHVRLGSIHPVRGGRYGPTLGWVRVVAVNEVRLSSLTEADAKDEGFADLPALRSHWQECMGKWHGKRIVSDIRFALWDKPERSRRQLTLFDEEGDSQ